MAEGALVCVAGSVLFRQRPGTAKGVVFITLEDEFGMTNLIISPELLQNHQPIILYSNIMFAEGQLRKIGPMTYISVKALASLDDASPCRY